MESIAYYTDDLGIFIQICYELSMFLRELPSIDEKSAFDSAMENREKIYDYAYSLKTANWKEAEKIFEEWEFTTKFAPLIAKLYMMPSSYNTKELKHITNKYFKDAPKEKNFNINLFEQLQKKAADYYYEKGGKPTKELVAEIAKMLTSAFETFGYGSYPNGLVAVIRAFHNDAIEGVSLEMYQSDTVYDAKGFDYFDGIEYEKDHDKFWAKINISELIN